MVDQVLERVTLDRYAQATHIGEIGLTQPTRLVILREENLPGRSLDGAPHLAPSTFFQMLAYQSEIEQRFSRNFEENWRNSLERAYVAAVGIGGWSQHTGNDAPVLSSDSSMPGGAAVLFHPQILRRSQKAEVSEIRSTMWRVFMGLLLVSCAGDSHHTPFQITLSRGGGFAGLVSGYHLHEGGGIEAWSRLPGRGDSVLWRTTVPADSIDYLRDGLERSGALTTIYRRSGNMTTSVAYTTQDTSFTP